MEDELHEIQEGEIEALKCEPSGTVSEPSPAQ
jgi:hypothetical protein